MQRSENIAELAAALAKAQGAITGARKTSINPAFKAPGKPGGTKYADLSEVLDAIRAPMSVNGLSVVQQLIVTGDGAECSCTTMLMHSSGHWMEFAPFSVPVTKRDAQGFGSSATYCRRYSLMAAVGVAPIDDDGNSADDHDGGEQGSAPMPVGLLESAQAAAMEGRATFEALWKPMSAELRQHLRPHLESLRVAMASADAASTATEGGK